MDAVCFSEMSVCVNEACHLHTRHCENLKFHFGPDGFMTKMVSCTESSEGTDRTQNQN
jgi:hypothetical protein